MEARHEPLNGRTKACSVVLDEDDLNLIDEWRAKQPGIPARGTAIRHFIRKGVEAARSDAGSDAR